MEVKKENTINNSYRRIYKIGRNSKMKNFFKNIVIGICILFFVSSVVYGIYGIIKTKEYLNSDIKEPDTTNEVETSYIEKYNLSMQETAKYMGISSWSKNYFIQVGKISTVGGVILGVILAITEKYKGNNKNKFVTLFIQICIIFTILSVIINVLLLFLANAKVGKEVEPENYITEMVKIKEGDLISRAHMRYLSKAKITGMYLCEIIAVLSVIIGALVQVIKSEKVSKQRK